ncbi:MAG: hypothetical protein QXV35_00690 [Archaeoglobaceae archaeon]
MFLVEIAELKKAANENVDSILEEVFRIIDTSPMVRIDNLLRAAAIFKRTRNYQQMNKIIREVLEEVLREQDLFLRLTMLGKIAQKAVEWDIPDAAVKAARGMLYLAREIESREQREDAVLIISETILVIAGLSISGARTRKT